MRPERLGALGRGDCVPQRGLGFVGGFGMVSEPGGVGRAGRWPCERGDGEPVETDAAARLDRVLDRPPSELVAELDRSGARPKHSRPETFLERIGLVRRQRVEQPELDPRRRDRDGVEQRPRRRAQRGSASEHGVPDRSWNLTVSGGQHLCDEEGVATGLAVELASVDVRCCRQLGN